MSDVGFFLSKSGQSGSDDIAEVAFDERDWLSAFMNPATYARIPDFLRFSVRPGRLSMGPVHGGYDWLQRCYSAPIDALPSQRVISDAATLDALTGRLVICESQDVEGEWEGYIERFHWRTASANVDKPHYRVLLDLNRERFADFVQLLQATQALTELTLDFQNIDGPLEDDPMERPAPWDDIATPIVLLTSFDLSWSAMAPRG